ncbi:hypothetical protein PENSTE_c016G06653 [Penicillium steckii]|uniref:beta-N-acetylhexosaminidase n=1 Tax=Penicillium steckii TaxID=303698 RepID=A0A1V6SY79_9EURO|nr:hypothetical protein PENSTE_c016G06653 [Penicillium steckii]
MRWFVLFAVAATALQTLPPVKFEEATSDRSRGFSLAKTEKNIYIEEDFSAWTDKDGLTLIPPSALEFARTFRDDLQEISNSSWTIHKVHQFPEDASGVFLGWASGPKDEFVYQDGTTTEEGYTLRVDKDRVFIYGSGARGMWWGTRTLLQKLALNSDAFIPAGSVNDAPAYATRGFMLDAGRKWYSLDYLKELCTYASYFKLSEFHYHATDNFPLSRGPDVPWNEVYSQFALRPENPDLLPLVQRANETLSRSEFDELQAHCAHRGVTVIPEIESPGHCLSVTKWRPELALDQQDLLNLSHPDTIPLVKSIWSEFLPWFHTKEVHIGADEYDSSLANDYISFVNEMSDFVYNSSGKSIRIWGTYEPSETQSVNENTTIQHWQYGQSDPVALAEQGYRIINSEDWWAYMSLKNDHSPITPAPYPQFFNNSRVLNFGDKQGWQWTPDLFNPVNHTEQPSQSAVQGAILAAWNDNGPDATTQLEAYYAIRNGIPVVASRAWTGSRGLRLSERTLDKSLEILTSNAVSQNLDRRLLPHDRHSSGPLLTWTRPKSGQPSQKYRLGNGSKGMNYTLEITATGPFILESKDVTLSMARDGELTFTSDGWPYPLRSVAETDGFDPIQPGRIWVNATGSSHEIVKVPQRANIRITTNEFAGSRVWVNDKFAGRFEVFVYGGKNKAFSWSQMAFVAPLETVRGELQRLVLR